MSGSEHSDERIKRQCDSDSKEAVQSDHKDVPSSGEFSASRAVRLDLWDG